MEKFPGGPGTFAGWRRQHVRSSVESRGWSFYLLSDLKYPQNGVCGYETDRQTWTLVIQGKLGIMLINLLVRYGREQESKFMWYE